jgi:hypothetical protein
MYVILNFANGVLHFKFNFEQSDRESYGINGKIVTSYKRECVTYLPQGCTPQTTHPDLLALSILLCIFPFIGTRLKLNFKVSEEFAAEVEQQLKIRVEPSCSTISKRTVPATFAKGKAGLAFSMGIDSTAALLLMPKTTACVFSDRIFDPRIREQYNKDNIYYGIKKIMTMCENPFYAIRTNYEDLRWSIGFTIDIGAGIPTILLADYLGLESVGYGYSLHDIKQVSNDAVKYICCGDHHDFAFDAWSNVFKAAGIYLNFITAGLSEIATCKIVMKSPYFKLISPCMRGKLHEQCLKCPKCLKKLMVKYAMEYQNLNDPKIRHIIHKLITMEHARPDRILQIHGIELSLLYLLNMAQMRPYLLQQLPFLKYAKAEFERKYTASQIDMTNKYLDKWIPSSEKYIPAKYRSFIKSMLIKYKIYNA